MSPVSSDAAAGSSSNGGTETKRSGTTVYKIVVLGEGGVGKSGELVLFQ
mgnify:CR=1 FL=1